MPADHIQGSAQAEWMAEEGVKKLYILDDKQVYGVGVAKTTGDAAELNDIEVVGTDSIDPKAPNYRSLAAKIKDSGADAVFYGGITANNAVQLYKDLGAALPDATLWGPDGVAESTFTNDLPKDVADRTYITVATIPEGLRARRARSSSRTSRRSTTRRSSSPTRSTASRRWT